MSQCAVDRCELPSRARGWCSAHYKRWQKKGTTDGPLPTQPHLRYWAISNANPERIAAKLAAAIPTDREGCWPWPGTKLLNGYGVFSIGGRDSNRRIYVHRASYEHHVGPIPEGDQIDHLCRNRACFNPAHLEAVVNRTNFIRGEHPNAVAFRTDMCRKGLHELTGDNVRLSPSGHRRCLACHAAWRSARRAT